MSRNPQPSTPTGDLRYWCFISYSSRDTALSKRLYHALETYDIPRDLVGRTGRDGPIPRNLFPCFRDREELPLSSDLGGSIQDALRASRYLIVICTPASAQSRWVNEEVLYFKSLGRADRILALIASGEPNASDKPGHGAQECFCPGLRHVVDANGHLTAERAEPIAGDLRKGGDGWNNAFLKAVSGVTGLGFNSFAQREEKRRRRWWQLLFACLGALLVAGMGWLFFYFPFGGFLTRASYDLPFALQTRIATPEICFVTMDEKSARALHQPFDAPWDRRLYARLIDGLTKAGARASLIDAYFDLPSVDATEDRALADALTASGRVFLGGHRIRQPDRPSDEYQIIPPSPTQFRHAAKAWGLLDFWPVDRDMEVRQMDLGDELVPSTTWQLVSFLGARLPKECSPMPVLWLNYYSPPDKIPRVGFDQALRADKTSPDLFRNTIVLVGSQNNCFRSPYTIWGQPFLSEADIHATTLLNLLRGDWLVRLTPIREGVVIAGFGAITSLAFALVRPFGLLKRSGAAVLLAVVIFATACWTAWTLHLWFDWAILAAVETPAALAWSIFTDYLLGTRRSAIRD
jgi:CHASE2 domain-containing sensor protein